jgi:predicted amidophosphoribosyltransferase
VCSLPDRGFSQIFTISEKAEEMWQLIYRYKYGEQKQLADDLGRMLVDYLQTHRAELGRFDLVTTVALYIGPEAPRLWDYLQLLVDAAKRIDDSWPFETEVIQKVRPTGRFLGLGVEERRVIAEGELRNALQVPNPHRVQSKRVLVIDDAYSEGFSLREMALALRQAGAVEVAGLVCARRKGA